MTLDDLDAMIDGTPNAAAIYVTNADWHALFGSPSEGREVLKSGWIVYRGLPVWIKSPGETMVIDRARAARDGLLNLKP